MTERRKFTLYMHPDEEADALGIAVLESVSQRVRGDFLRTAVLASCALHTIDRRLPVLLASLFDGKMDADQLVGLIRQTTGWKPGMAEIQDVVEALTGMMHPEGKHRTVQTKGQTTARANMDKIFSQKD
ncbi:MAG: hypothetical protein XXXJIFNMEKO3_LKCDNKCA_00151 (plasmid) [Candidatus Erwinia impunctatus]